MRELIEKFERLLGEMRDSWADSRETSVEIADAIHEIARSKRTPEKIWEDPTRSELKKVLKMAFSETDDDELFWGETTFSRP